MDAYKSFGNNYNLINKTNSCNANITSNSNISNNGSNNSSSNCCNNRSSNSYNNSNRADFKIIAIGASAGGTEAIYTILRSLPKNIPGIVIVQHIPPVFSKMFAERLNDTTEFDVKEAETGDCIETGKVLIAPGEKHMIVVKEGSTYKVECFMGEKVSGHRPSIDVLFESVSKVCGKNAIGIILTGMGHDGSKGLLAMRNKGARTIGQDEKTSIVYGMPKVAYNIGAVEFQVPLQKIPETICSLLGIKYQF
ncbi:MAG TPA: chemotaxis protein CheB [Clostridiaceae bacterium]|nr:chemotaxis protein CheB [Clostridiaceae bacterium]